MYKGKIKNNNIDKLKSCYRSAKLDKNNSPNASFEGPSKYFSQEALKACERHFLGTRHLEMIYAMLPAWGMHRSGNSGSKMPEYDVFCKSILSNKDILFSLKEKRVYLISELEWGQVQTTFEELLFGENRIIASTTKAKIVSGSKTLAHILPHLIPPIDRHYTASFFGFDRHYLSKSKEIELFRTVMQHMHSIYEDEEILKLALALQKKDGISLPKIFDNAIIAIQNDKKN